jgi:hypothetical protein
VSDLDDETKARIDAEERYRAHARARAEQSLNRPSQTPKAMSAPETAQTSTLEPATFLAGCVNTVSGCLVFVVVAAVLVFALLVWIGQSSGITTSTASTTKTQIELAQQLLEIGERPALQRPIVQSDEDGRKFYDLGVTEYGETKVVWYSQDSWWLEIKSPSIKLADFATNTSSRGGNEFVTQYRIMSGPLQNSCVLESTIELSIQTATFCALYGSK